MITATFLSHWFRLFGVIPRRRLIPGMAIERVIPPHTTSTERLVWFAFPPLVEPTRELHARVLVVDSLGERHWTPKLRWFDMAEIAGKQGR